MSQVVVGCRAETAQKFTTAADSGEIFIFSETETCREKNDDGSVRSRDRVFP